MSELTSESTPEQIVSSPATTDDLEQEMKRVAKPFGKPTIALGVLVVLALAFGGGAWMHSALAGTATTSPAFAATAGPAGAQGRQGQQAQGGTGRQGGFARGTTGTVDRVDGTTIYVKTPQGNELKVSTSDTTQVSVAQPAKVTDLKPGSDVVVQGETGGDGTVTAQSITQQPAGGR
jgi:hypothetical protein